MNIIKANTTDGLKLSGLFWKPEKTSSRIIIHIHGMAGDPYTNEFVTHMGQGYPEAGIAFLSVETRGTHGVTTFTDNSGAPRILGSAFELFEDSVLDIQAWIDKVKELGFSEVWLQGHSLGCSKVAYYASENLDSPIAGLLLVSPSDMLGWNLAAENIAAHKRSLEEALGLLKAGKENVVLSELLDGEFMISAATYNNLFGEGAKDAVFNFGNPELGYEVLNKLSLPVLAFTGTEDGGTKCSGDPKQAMVILEVQLKNSPKKKTVVFDGAQHSFAGFEKDIIKEVTGFIL